MKDSLENLRSAQDDREEDGRRSEDRHYKAKSEKRREISRCANRHVRRSEREKKKRRLAPFEMTGLGWDGFVRGAKPVAPFEMTDGGR